MTLTLLTMLACGTEPEIRHYDPHSQTVADTAAEGVAIAVETIHVDTAKAEPSAEYRITVNDRTFTAKARFVVMRGEDDLLLDVTETATGAQTTWSLADDGSRQTNNAGDTVEIGTDESGAALVFTTNAGDIVSADASGLEEGTADSDEYDAITTMTALGIAPVDEDTLLALEATAAAAEQDVGAQERWVAVAIRAAVILWKARQITCSRPVQLACAGTAIYGAGNLRYANVASYAAAGCAFAQVAFRCN